MKNLYLKNNNYQESIDKQAGVTLIEALVTLLILSVGALGIASMQLAGLKYASGSYGRTQAVILADDMANRLKSNRVFALGLDDSGEIAQANSPYELLTFDAPTPTVAVDCATETCAPDELADFDLQAWRNELARVLPSGRGMITTLDRNVTGFNGDTITQRQFNIAVEWRQVSSSTSNNDAAIADNFNADNELQSITFRILL